MPTVRSEVQPDLTSTYYDTLDLALHREMLTLRVRKQGRKFVQTVKAVDLAGPSLFARREWEDPIASRRPDIDASKTGRRLPESIRGQDLRPVFTTSVTRTVIEIEPKPATRIEAAIDEGKIRTTDDSVEEPISEMELELKSGDPATLFDVALRLLEAAPVRIETRSKAERGYRLLGAVGLPQAVHTGPVVLDPTMDVETALQHFGRQCLTHLLRNEPVMLAGEPEGIHQMRVAVRRFRSGLSALKPMLPLEERCWVSAELEQIPVMRTRILHVGSNWRILAG
jgi:inorganic triphosphatase YgiF